MKLWNSRSVYKNHLHIHTHTKETLGKLVFFFLHISLKTSKKSNIYGRDSMKDEQELYLKIPQSIAKKILKT